MNKVPMLAQVMFFGALLSAIKSCASATCSRHRSPLLKIS
jgi:hypothetical protein